MIKTIDVIALEWFDKINGNSYFAGTVTTNFGMDDEKTYKMPYQYGYGSQYTQEAGSLLDNEGVIALKKYETGDKEPLWSYCKDNGIILRATKHENCKKAQLKNI